MQPVIASTATTCGLRFWGRVRFAAARGGGVGIIEIRFACDCFARSQIRVSINRDDLGREFVAEDARVFEKGLPPVVGMDVRPAHPDPPDPDTGLSRCRIG
jgi:hypothetical protein